MFDFLQSMDDDCEQVSETEERSDGDGNGTKRASNSTCEGTRREERVETGAKRSGKGSESRSESARFKEK